MFCIKLAEQCGLFWCRCRSGSNRCWRWLWFRLFQRLGQFAARHWGVHDNFACVDAGRDDGHAHATIQGRVHGGSNDDICFWINLFADAVGCFVQFKQGKVFAAGDVDKHTTRATQADFVQEWVGDGFFRRLDRAIFAGCFAGAHHGFAHLVHHGTNVCKVEVDKARTHHQVGHAFDALVKNIIGHREGFGEGSFLIRQTEQVLVWNDDQSVDDFLKRFNAGFRLTHALGAFELEWLGDDPNGQNTQLAGRLCDDWGRAGTGAAAHACGDETHVRASEVIDDLFDALFCCGRTHGWACPCAKALGGFDT